MEETGNEGGSKKWVAALGYTLESGGELVSIPGLTLDHLNWDLWRVGSRH